MADDAKTISDALDALRADRSTPVRARVAGLLIELRAIEENVAQRSALEMFEEIGAWVGDDADMDAPDAGAGT